MKISDQDHDPLEKLLGLASRRQPMDSKRKIEIQRSTHERWQLVLERRYKVRRRRHFMQFFAGVATVALLVLAYVNFPDNSLPRATFGVVTKLIGTPQYGPPGDALSNLAVGTELPIRSVMVTGPGEGVALRLASGHSVRVDESSRLRTETGVIVLDDGAVYVDSDAAVSAATMEVLTPLARLRELGTQYMARLYDSSLEVSVREGIVNVDYPNGRMSARSGEVIRLDQSGRTQSLSVSLSGKHWAWAARLAKLPPLEGATLAEFLRWLAREQGWQLSYVSPEVAEAAERVTLTGDIGDLGGEESLAAVMTITGWRHELNDGVLIISAGQ